MTYLLIVLFLIFIVILIHDTYVISHGPKCPDCEVKSEYNNNWSRFYCPKCHKRV